MARRKYSTSTSKKRNLLSIETCKGVDVLMEPRDVAAKARKNTRADLFTWQPLQGRQHRKRNSLSLVLQSLFENKPFTSNHVVQSKDVYRAAAAKSGKEEGGGF
jgi:hypothetical protein